MIPIRLYQGSNIDQIYRKYANDLKELGFDIKFGNPAQPKHARNLFAIIHLHGKAVKDVLNGETPIHFPWSGDKVKELMENFDRDATNPFGFDYTYPELLSHQIAKDGHYDQMVIARKQLKAAIDNNMFDTRNVGNLYEPGFANEENKPCFNWFQIQHIGDGDVVLVVLFRSHDYGSVVWGNLCAVSYWFNERVVQPAGGTLKEIVCISASAHVYNYDSDIIDRLCMLGEIGRFM